VIAISAIAGIFLRRRKKKAKASLPTALPAGAEGTSEQPAIEGGSGSLEDQIKARLAERDAEQKKAEAQALSALKLAPVITKTAEVLAKHLRERITKEPEVSAQVLRTWIREDEEVR